MTDTGLDYAYEECRRLARKGTTSGIFGGRFTPGQLRKHFCVVRAFARRSSDLAGSDRAAQWRAGLEALPAGKADDPVLKALAATVRDFSLPLAPLRDILDGAEADRSARRIDGTGDLLRLCRLTAAPQGRLLLLMHGHRDTSSLELSDKLFTAYRLTEILLEVRRDLDRDRILLPQSDFREFGYSEADLRMGVVNERYRNLMKQQWKTARSLYEEARPLFSRLNWAAGWEPKLAYLRGSLLLRKIRRLGFDTLRQSPAIKKWDWPRLAGGALLLR